MFPGRSGYDAMMYDLLFLFGVGYHLLVHFIGRRNSRTSRRD
jgi:hypothetical protein